MAHVARRLLYDDRQLLLGNGEHYWVAHGRVDSGMVRERLRLRLRRGKTFGERTELEIRVAQERKLVSHGEISQLRRDIAS